MSTVGDSATATSGAGGAGGAGTEACRYLRALARRLGVAYVAVCAPRAILLTGSAATGDSDHCSDVDIKPMSVLSTMFVPVDGVVVALGPVAFTVGVPYRAFPVHSHLLHHPR